MGATKTVIGSKLVPELLDSLDPQVRSQVSRCPCVVTFRFGNHGILQSQQALVVPIAGLQLKIAVVPGATPFLLSNTLLRAIEATVNTSKHILHSAKLGKDFKLHLTSKGLFLLNLNELAQPIRKVQDFSMPAETHVMCETAGSSAQVSKTTEAEATSTDTDHDQLPINYGKVTQYIPHEGVFNKDSN